MSKYDKLFQTLRRRHIWRNNTRLIRKSIGENTLESHSQSRQHRKLYPISDFDETSCGLSEDGHSAVDANEENTMSLDTAADNCATKYFDPYTQSNRFQLNREYAVEDFSENRSKKSSKSDSKQNAKKLPKSFQTFYKQQNLKFEKNSDPGLLFLIFAFLIIVMMAALVSSSCPCSKFMFW